MEYTFKTLKHKTLEGIFANIIIEPDLSEIGHTTIPTLYNTTSSDIDVFKKYFKDYPPIFKQLDDYELVTVKLTI